MCVVGFIWVVANHSPHKYCAPCCSHEVCHEEGASGCAKHIRAAGFSGFSVLRNVVFAQSDWLLGLALLRCPWAK